MEPPRSRQQRKSDVLRMLQPEAGVQKDAWVASAGDDGRPYLVPLTYFWDGEALVFATASASRTGRNLKAGRVRVALGETRDVVMIEGQVSLIAAKSADGALVEAHTSAAGFDARKEADYVYVRLVPEKIQAWREVNELTDERNLMTGGKWLT
jgi:hypothetical protein